MYNAHRGLFISNASEKKEKQQSSPNNLSEETDRQKETDFFFNFKTKTQQVLNNVVTLLTGFDLTKCCVIEGT